MYVSAHDLDRKLGGPSGSNDRDRNLLSPSMLFVFFTAPKKRLTGAVRHTQPHGWNDAAHTRTQVVSITIEGPPQQEERPRKGVTATGMAVPPSLHGPGMGVSAGRGLAPPMMGAAPGLSGPARGVGGPAPAALRPQFGAPAMPYAGTGGPGMPPPMRPGMPPPMSQPPRPPGPPPM